METLKIVIILSALLVCYGDARRSKKLYRIKIDERGTRFNETVEINEKEKSVVYKVPSHNDIMQSETRFDYKTGYFATRIPKLRECYIQRIPKGHSSPGSVRKYLQQYRVHKKGKSTVPVKTIATSVIKERRISRREISSRLAAFCGDFEVYEGREVYHREILQMKENETNGGRKKARSVLFSYPVNYLPRTVVSKKIDVDVGRKDKWETVTINTCEKLQKYVPELKIGGCFNNSDDWEYHCYAKTKTCIYKVKCKLDSSYKIRCEETHFYSGWTCCDVKCS